MTSTNSKTRTPLTTMQKALLVEFYNRNPYPSATERERLVQNTGRTSKQIQDWFANRRRNDSRLINPQSNSNGGQLTPPSVVKIEPIPYSDQPPLPSPHVCSCCGLPQSLAIIDQTYYPNFYSSIVCYPFSNDYYSSI